MQLVVHYICVVKNEKRAFQINNAIKVIKYKK